jgi:hypothetical protein
MYIDNLTGINASNPAPDVDGDRLDIVIPVEILHGIMGSAYFCAYFEKETRPQVAL